MGLEYMFRNIKDFNFCFFSYFINNFVIKFIYANLLYKNEINEEVVIVMISVGNKIKTGCG